MPLVVSLDGAVSSSGLSESVEFLASRVVGAMIGAVEISECGPGALAVDEVDRTDEELAGSLHRAASGRGMAGGFPDVALADAVLSLDSVGGLWDASVVVAMVEAGAVAIGDGADVPEETTAPSAFASAGRGGDGTVDQRLEARSHALAVLRRCFRPQDGTHLAEEVDVLAKLVPELVASPRGLQRPREPAEEGRWAP